MTVMRDLIMILIGMNIGFGFAIILQSAGIKFRDFIRKSVIDSQE